MQGPTPVLDDNKRLYDPSKLAYNGPGYTDKYQNGNQ